MDQDELPVEAIGEDELQRPQPADEPISVLDSQDLYRVMRRTIERLEEDQTARGDLKILSRTLRELRKAFTVFRPFRRRRKVTIFGSARTEPDHPEYQSAVQLGRRMAQHGWMVITGAGGGIMEAAVCRKSGIVAALCGRLGKLHSDLDLGDERDYRVLGRRQRVLEPATNPAALG